jgi:hypothetical protein
MKRGPTEGTGDVIGYSLHNSKSERDEINKMRSYEVRVIKNERYWFQSSEQ